MSTVGGCAKLAAIIILFLIAAPFQIFSNLCGFKLARILPVIFHRMATRILGIHVETCGVPPGRTPTLVVSNHVSWIDIVVVSSLQPFSFIAKSEIEKWPVFGLLAKLQNSVFIDRQRRRATAEANHAIARRLADGDAMILFAEGTTSDGCRLLPFRSSLVGAVHTAMRHDGEAQQRPPVEIRPLAISYKRRNGLPLTRRDRPQIAWYGDMTLAPHLWDFVRGGTLDVTLSWGEPIPLISSPDRKTVTAQAEATVRQMLRR